MRLLLDTHALIWAFSEPRRLTPAQRQAVSGGDHDVFISAASAWEIAIKRALGRIEFPVERFAEMAADMGFETLPMTVAHAITAGGLPRHHDDPFDRMLIAQALHEGQTIVTVDGHFRKYDVAVFGADA